MTLNPREPYIAINDLPKIGELKRFFPELCATKPVLVSPRTSRARRLLRRPPGGMVRPSRRWSRYGQTDIAPEEAFA